MNKKRIHLHCKEETCEHSHPSKLQIFLLVVIIIGIGLIITQTMWVPKIVNSILLQK